MNARTDDLQRGRSSSIGLTLALLIVAAAGAPACGDDDDSDDDAGPVDAGPWLSGVLTCGNDVMTEYATREYTFSDPFDRQDLGRFWVSDSEGWTIQTESRLAVSGGGDGPGANAMVADGQRGTDLVGWVDVQRAGNWDPGPELLCRADGPPVTAAYGMRILGDHIELFRQTGSTTSGEAEVSAPLSENLTAGGNVRAVIGCTGDTVTGFVFALSNAGEAAGEQLGCATWRHEDEARSGAFALTQQGGSSAFDNVRLVVDP